MTVDLKTLKVGDTVHFRCGGKAIAAHLERTTCIQYPYGVQFDRYDRFYGPDENYRADGTCRLLAFPHPLDIIAVEPAPHPSLAEQCARAYECAVNRMLVQDNPISMDALGYDDRHRLLACWESLIPELRKVLVERLAADDGWIEWKGGENPARGCDVVVRFRNGNVAERDDANSRYWHHRMVPGDIVAYRIVND